jgi:CAAX protease family protein
MLERVFLGSGGVRAGWRLLLFAVLTIILYITIQSLLTISGLHWDLTNGLSAPMILVSESVTFLCPLFAALIMGHLEHKQLRDYGLPAEGAFGRRFWVGAGIGVVALSVLLAAIYLSGGFHCGSLALGARGILYFGILWGVAFLAVGLSEEFLFRGYALATLAEGIGFWPAAILLSLLFGAVHLSNLGENPTGAISAAVVGLLFCFSFRRTGNLWFAIGLHAAWDYGESFIFSVPDSGVLVRGHLLNSYLQVGAPAWLTGGAVGPEGSLFIFVVLGALFVVVDRMYPEVKFPLRVETDGHNLPPDAGAALQESEAFPGRE